MEIEGSDGSKTRLKPDCSTVFGRGYGFHSNDLSVSRRHISFHFNPSPNSQTDPRVSFEVLGKNPVWVFDKHHENGSIKAFKRFQRGELGIDDLFCISPNNPIWFTVKKVEETVKEREFENEETKSRINDDFGLDSVDVSSIDPVQEFGFLVIGHEFDQYPKQMIRESRIGIGSLTILRKYKWKEKEEKTSKGDDDDVDEEWTVESEGDEIATNARKVQRPKYSTRSKVQGVHDKGTMNRKSSTRTSRSDEEEESEDEEDETLGGFVVTDDVVEEDEVDEDDEEDLLKMKKN
ncbi:Small ubiquitin-related modifier 3 [Bienertia sinuspersici]